MEQTRRVNILELKRQFPNDGSCLDYIFRTKYPTLTGYSRVSTRMCYSNSKGHQIYPLKGTIFERTRVPLTLWFHALFLFYVSKNGVSAAELSRQLGIRHKSAWRMGHAIRRAMKEEGLTLFGTVEVDETYYGGVHRQKDKFRKKKVLLGMVERGGRVKVQVVPHRGTEALLPRIGSSVARGSRIMSDEFKVYKKLPKMGYKHQFTKHGKGHYVRGDIHSNSLEGFWGHLKPSLQGTFRHVRYLQLYVDEFAWKYNRRGQDAFPELLARAVSSS